MPSAHLALHAPTPVDWPWITIMDGSMDGGWHGSLRLGSDGEHFTLHGQDIILPLDIPGHVSHGPSGTFDVVFVMLGATAELDFTAGVGDFVGESFIITGATAATTWNAPAPIDPVVGSASLYLPGATADLIFSAPPGDVSIPADTVIPGVTATLTAQALPGAAATSGPIGGDSRHTPIPITYLGLNAVNVQAFHPNLYTSTVEVDEPEPGTLAATVWYRLTSDRPITVAVTFTGTITGMDLFDDTFTLIAYTGTFTMLPGVFYYLRAGTDTPSGIAEFILTATPIVIPATVGATNPDRTPATITVNGSGFPPDSPVVLVASGGHTVTVQSDSSGMIPPTDMLIGSTLNPGTYSITATSGATVANGSFTVLYAPLPGPEAPVEDAAPPTIPVGPSVIKWLLKDPTSGTLGLGDYTFPFNPSEMTPPFAPANLTVDTTTAGGLHIWEGGLRAHEWSFSGYFDTEADHDSLAAFRALNRRFYLRDHRARVWTVTFTGFDPQPLRAHGKPWAHKYTVNALIYSGPVMEP